MLRILSLGAGVQSSYLALRCARGEFEPVQHAIFADTGDEPEAVYAWLDWLEAEIARQRHPFPIHRVEATAGRLSDASTLVRLSKKSGRTYLASSVPVHIDNGNGKKGMFPRHCTRNHKIDPINRKMRELAKVPRGAKTFLVECVIGISLDEWHRMKPSPHAWIYTEWPLVDAGITRADILRWFDEEGLPKPPRSACVYCPYHSDAEWRNLKENDIRGFNAAVDYEKRLQAAFKEASALDGMPFLHASLRPLEEVEFTANDDEETSGWGNECEGMCGL